MKKIKEVVKQIKNDIWSVKWAILAFVIYLLVMKFMLGTICPIKAITGIPCPGCGMTRAFFYLLMGRWSLSFQMHPMLIPWIFFMLYLVFIRYFYNKKPKGMIVILTLLCIAMFLVYFYRMAFFFPGQEPMTYVRPGGMLWKK